MDFTRWISLVNFRVPIEPISYYEAIQKILPGVKLYINTATDGGDVQMLLPLESLMGGTN